MERVHQPGQRVRPLPDHCLLYTSIADYEAITEQYGSLSCGPAVEAGHYDTFEDALADPRVTTAECPKCGAVMACTRCV